MNLQVLIQRDEDGKYVASCPAIHGCHSQGDTYEETMKNIKGVAGGAILGEGRVGLILDMEGVFGLSKNKAA